VIRVCSGFSPKGYEEYGRNFLKTFDRYWPKEIELAVYTEEPVPMPRGVCRSLWECNGVAEFIARHKDDPEKCGTKPNHLWNPRHVGRPYWYRFDAVKFCRQMFIPEHAARGLSDGDILVWLDGDVVTFENVPDRFIESLLNGHEISYLGRPGRHSEIGYWAVRINDRTRRFLVDIAEVWRTDRVFSLPEWHSAFVFDWVRKTSGLDEINLTPTGNGHVWGQSPLHHYTNHLKGNLKTVGYSPDRKRKA
jgi:hypothetical protein